MHANARHAPILSQSDWSASRSSPFAIQSQMNVWPEWPRCGGDGLPFGERVPDALLIRRKQKPHSIYSLVTPHQQLPSHTITANATAFSTTPARHITSTPLLTSISYLMLANVPSVCPVSSMRSGTRHWTRLRCLRRSDSRVYRLLTEAQPEAGRIAVTMRLPNVSQHRVHGLCRLGEASDIWCCVIACFIL